MLAGDGEVEARLYIHGRMHVARPELRCILHTHMPYATALTSTRPRASSRSIRTRCASAAASLTTTPTAGFYLDAAEGDRLAAALGDKRVLFMANHGVITTGRIVAAAFDDLYYLERACQNQVLMATGRPLKRVPAAEVERTRAEFDLYEEQADLHFTALKRMSRENPTTRREARSPGDELIARLSERAGGSAFACGHARR